MDSETKQLLEKIFAAQIVIYRKLRKVEEKSKGTTSMDSYDKDLRELNSEIEKISDYLNK